MADTTRAAALLNGMSRTGNIASDARTRIGCGLLPLDDACSRCKCTHNMGERVCKVLRVCLSANTRCHSLEHVVHYRHIRRRRTAHFMLTRRVRSTSVFVSMCAAAHRRGNPFGLRECVRGASRRRLHKYKRMSTRRVLAYFFHVHLYLHLCMRRAPSHIARSFHVVDVACIRYVHITLAAAAAVRGEVVHRRHRSARPRRSDAMFVHTVRIILFMYESHYSHRRVRRRCGQRAGGGRSGRPTACIYYRTTLSHIAHSFVQQQQQNSGVKLHRCVLTMSSSAAVAQRARAQPFVNNVHAGQTFETSCCGNAPVFRTPPDLPM